MFYITFGYKTLPKREKKKKIAMTYFHKFSNQIDKYKKHNDWA